MTNKKRRVFRLLTGFVVGSAVGSILGMTIAPKKGSETRKAIRDKSMDLYLKGKTQIKQDANISPLKRKLINWLLPKNKR